MKSKEQFPKYFYSIAFHGASALEFAMDYFYKYGYYNISEINMDDRDLIFLTELITDKRIDKNTRRSLIELGVRIDYVLKKCNIYYYNAIVNPRNGYYKDDAYISCLTTDNKKVDLVCGDASNIAVNGVIEDREIKYYITNDKCVVIPVSKINEETLDNKNKFIFVKDNIITCILENENYRLCAEVNSIVDQQGLSSTIKNIVLPANVEEVFGKVIDKFVVKPSDNNLYLMVEQKSKHTSDCDRIVVSNNEIKIFEQLDDFSINIKGDTKGNIKNWNYMDLEEEKPYKYSYLKTDTVDSIIIESSVDDPVDDYKATAMEVNRQYEKVLGMLR